MNIHIFTNVTINGSHNVIVLNSNKVFFAFLANLCAEIPFPF